MPFLKPIMSFGNSVYINRLCSKLCSSTDGYCEVLYMRAVKVNNYFMKKNFES